VSSTLPTISGTPIVGQTLSASSGSWSGSTPMSYAYSWARCNSTGGSCAPISGATSTTYLLASADAGSTIRVTVTAKNGAGSATATSAATAVAASAPSAPSSPTLGTALPSRMPASSGTVTTVSSMSALSSAIGNASAGAVIEVRGGSYSGTLAINSKRLTATDIAAKGPITITNYPGETVTFTGPSSQTMGGLFLIDNSQGIRLKGSGGDFIIDAPYMGGGVKIDTSQHIEIDGLVLRNIGLKNGYGGGPILVASNSGNALTYSTDVQIWNNTISNWGQDTTSGIGGQHGIYYGSRGGQSTSTRSGAEYGVIANNVIYDGQGGYGIQLGDQARHTVVTNNTIVHMEESAHGVGSGIVTWSSGGTYGSQSNILINNIISSNVAFAVQASGNSVSPTTVRDNLAYANALAPPAYQTYNTSGNLSIGTNLPDANPLYVNYTGKDFHLQAGSPALGKADPAYTPPFDKDGKARPATPALGAFG
jgi:hypothetical protein